jgi:hypothetical protein
LGDVLPALERVVERCLEKNVDERFQSARNLAFAIDTSGAGWGSKSEAAVVGAAPTRPAAPLRWILVAGALALGLVVGFAIARKTTQPAPSEPVRVRVLMTSGADSEPTVSPDGRP